MPRKTKDQTELQDETLKVDTKVSKTTKATKKSDESKPKSTKKTSSKTSKEPSKKATTKTKTSASKKVSSSSKSKASTPKSSTSQKTTTRKSSAKKTVSKKAETKKTAKKKIDIVEYYDLPYRYNQTIVKVLYQTPKTLFIYWDISDSDRKSFEDKYGENFFYITRPILIVHNDTLGYSFEVEINDFANSWYLHVADAKCDYRIELGRRPIEKNEAINTDYIYISMSNKIESPNDHILFNKEQKMVYYKNIKTGALTKKPISSISFIRNIGKIYNIYDLYKAIYADENVEEIYDLSNPSSGNPSSRNSSIITI